MIRGLFTNRRSTPASGVGTRIQRVAKRVASMLTENRPKNLPLVPTLRVGTHVPTLCVASRSMAPPLPAAHGEPYWLPDRSSAVIASRVKRASGTPFANSCSRTRASGVPSHSSHSSSSTARSSRTCSGSVDGPSNFWSSLGLLLHLSRWLARQRLPQFRLGQCAKLLQLHPGTLPGGKGITIEVHD